MKAKDLVVLVLIGALTAVFGLVLDGKVQVSVDQLTVQEMIFLENDPLITHKVIFEITQKFTDETVMEERNRVLGTITLGLFGTELPVTVSNFVHLANMTYGYGYKDVTFHRIIRDFMIQGGDFQHGTGTGGVSVYNKGQFDDENFTFKHNKMGRLSMANRGPDTNGAQFFITTAERCDWLDGHHVVFGQTIDGFDVLRELNEVEVTKDHMPLAKYYVSNIAITSIIKTEDPMGLDKNKIENFLQPEILVDPEPRYAIFIYSLMGFGLFLLLRNWYFKRQYLQEISKSDYF